MVETALAQHPPPVEESAITWQQHSGSHTATIATVSVRKRASTIPIVGIPFTKSQRHRPTLGTVLSAFQMDAIRAEEFLTTVIRPLATPVRQLLGVEVAHFAARLPFEEVRKARRRPVELGYRWGPVWSTAWFRLHGSLPRAFRGYRTMLHFSSGTEACVHCDGTPFSGFDPYHDTAPLIPSQWKSRARAKGGERIDVWVEAACNLPLGATTFWWDQPEQRARWNEAKPGRLESAEVVAIDEEVWQFCERFDWLRRQLWSGAAQASRTNDLARGLAAIIRAIPAASATREVVLRQRSALDRLLRGRRDHESATTCVAIGHAHIDTAWLWRIDETRRKCLRTFATALRNIERFDHFRFVASQAQQYQFVKEESPGLMAAIKRAVAAGRWEPMGAMWVEPDATAPCGESFIRQIVHGTRWWNREFPGAPRQRILYLPDTFGFPACLPQIMAKAGLDTFITNKIAWSDTNSFPHVSFNWRGLDSTSVLAHCTPGHNYNSDFLPADLSLAEGNIERLDRGRTRIYLQPYGWGDGGGGPDPSQIERTKNAARCEGMPRTRHTSATAFCDALHEEASRSEAAGSPLPVWDGELYLEAHRGTYTSQRWIKQANRQCERLLREVEMLAVLAPPPRAALKRLVGELDGLWKTVLLHQFHDILPGSSIGPVYDDARRALGDAVTRLQALRSAGHSRAAARVGVRGGERLAFNPASVACGGLPACAVGVPEKGGKDDAIAASAHLLTLSNSFMRVKLDPLGRVREIVTAHGATRPAPSRAFNELVLYEDRPRRWEAWDTDKEYLEKPTPVVTRCTTRASVRGGIARIECTRRLGRASALTQVYELASWSDTLVIRTRLDWREERTLLRALFPTRLRSRTALFGTQLGHISRDAHRNTSWQEAQFEVPGHDWMSLADGATSFAVVDDGIFGKSAVDGELGLSLAKSPNFPDPTADRGVHEFAYGIRVGDASDANAWVSAERLNHPPQSIKARAGKVGHSQPQSLQFVAINSSLGAESVEVLALKPADDGSGDVILRVVDRSGGAQRLHLTWRDGARTVMACDFFERPLRGTRLAMTAGASVASLGAFEIASWRIVRPRRQSARRAFGPTVQR